MVNAVSLIPCYYNFPLLYYLLIVLTVLYQKKYKINSTRHPWMFNCLSGPTSHVWMTQTYCNLLSPTYFCKTVFAPLISKKLTSENLFWTLQFLFLFRSSNFLFPSSSSFPVSLQFVVRFITFVLLLTIPTKLFIVLYSWSVLSRFSFSCT